MAKAGSDQGVEPPHEFSVDASEVVFEVQAQGTSVPVDRSDERPGSIDQQQFGVIEGRGGLRWMRHPLPSSSGNCGRVAQSITRRLLRSGSTMSTATPRKAVTFSAASRDSSGRK